jgi:hypothetical protein
MDGSATEIVLNEKGICNFCTMAQHELALSDKLKPLYKAKIREIKKGGKGMKYDCLIGLSGGVDSSYTLLKAVQAGLRPLCFSVDNGWNDPRADENIMRLVEGLKVPFYRYTIDTKRFTELQGAFMKAGLRNLEIPTDHILMATTLEMADKYGIKIILSGGNVATESIMPASWGYSARDLVHIKDVYRRMTGKNLTGLPTCSLLKWNYYRWIARIETLYLLDYLDYNRKKAIKELKKFGYKEYGEKHCESIFTAWFQNYYLFEKFSIDKRKAHFSSMINSKQMTRSQALEELANSPIYPEIGLEKKILAYPKRSHDDFRKDEKLFRFIAKIVKLCV